MKFRYKKFGNFLRPVIPVTVYHDNQKVTYEVLVDSGADFSVFDAEIGDLVGLDISSGKRGVVSGIAGQSSSYFMHKIQISVGGWEFETNVAFMSQVGQTLNYGVVGQIGLFENFVVTFDLSRREIELKPRL